MLKLAFQYKDKLDKAWQACVFQEKYQFYNYGNSWDYTINVKDSSWDSIQMVSVGRSDEVLGYIAACIDRYSYKVSNIGAINFGGLSLTFSNDFYNFLTELFTKHRFRKIEWRVVIGNPAERMYDKIIEKYGGRIIGIRQQATITSDGVLRDEKEYELFRKDFYASFRNLGRQDTGKGNSMKSKDRVPAGYREGTRDWDDQYNMLLDDGVTCNDCAHVERCCALFGQRPYVNDGRCQFYPNRFRAKQTAQAGEERKCRICGCTQNNACPGGCYWVAPDLCSACVQETGEEQDHDK